MRLTPFPPGRRDTPLCTICHRHWEADAPARQELSEHSVGGIPTVVPLTSEACVPVAVLRVELAGDWVDACKHHAAWWAKALDRLEEALVHLQPVEWDTTGQCWRIVRREEAA